MVPSSASRTIRHHETMRPHNKSTLWDEFLEHRDRDQKMFNAKHKRAYCRHCVGANMAKIEASTALRMEFQKNTDITESWDEWKQNKAFEMFEYISGRSSNMQRHIRTCPNLKDHEKNEIMERFRQTKEEKKARGGATESSVISAQRGTGGFASTRALPVESTPSDDDASNSSALNSPPPISRRNTTTSVESTPSEQKPSPSPRLSVQSMLNDDDGGPSSGSRGHPSDRFINSFTPLNITSSNTGGHSVWQSQQSQRQQQYRYQHRPHPSPVNHSPRTAMDHLERASTYTRRASEEIENARFSISGHRPTIRVQPPQLPHPRSRPQPQAPILPTFTSMNQPIPTNSIQSVDSSASHSMSASDQSVNSLIQEKDYIISGLQKEIADLKKKYNVLNEAHNRCIDHQRRSSIHGQPQSHNGPGTASGSSGDSEIGSRSGSSSGGSPASKRKWDTVDMDVDEHRRGRSTDEDNGEDEDAMMETPRASSAPALFSLPGPPPRTPPMRHDAAETASTSSKEYDGAAEAKKRKIAEPETEGRD